MGSFVYAKGAENFRDMRFILADKLRTDAVEKVRACNVPIETWDDGDSHVVLRLDKVSDDFVAKGTECLMKALPKDLAYQAVFLVSNFRDIAIGLVANGDIDLLRHEGLKTFMNRVALGEINVGTQGKQ